MEFKMNNFQNSLHSLLSWYLDVRSKTIDVEGEHRSHALANHIASGYRVLDINKLNLETISITPPHFNKSEYLQEDAGYRQPIAELYDFINSHLQEYISYFFLLSSLATLDYKKGWSDIDSFMVIQDDVVRDGRRLSKLRELCIEAWQYFLRITPLQHHGFIIVTESDLLSYPTSYMPPAVFEQSFSMLSDSRTITFKTKKSDSGALKGLKGRAVVLKEALQTGVFKHHPYQGRYLYTNFRNSEDAMYQLFCLLGYIMTVPAYFMDGIEKGCYKGESFNLARPFFSDRAWEVINKASEVRSLWEDREGVEYKLNAVPKWVQDVLGNYYIEESLIIIEEAIEKIISFQEGG
jgi:hypothetical protein